MEHSEAANWNKQYNVIWIFERFAIIDINVMVKDKGGIEANYKVFKDAELD